MNKFFVFYDYGSCNDGSHSSGAEEFDTLEEALKCIEVEHWSRARAEYWGKEPYTGQGISLIAGTEYKIDPEKMP